MIEFQGQQQIVYCENKFEHFGNMYLHKNLYLLNAQKRLIFMLAALS